MHMRIFITGATGAIGKTIVRALAKHHEMVALAYRKELSSQVNIKWVHGDLLRPETYLSHLHGCDALIHLAAETSNASMQLHAINVDATQRLLLAAEQCNVPKKIIFSSAAVTQKILTPYAESKKQMEKMIYVLGIPCTVLRPTIVYGPNSPYVRGMARYLELRLPFVPLSNDGKADLRPVHVDDLVLLLEKIISFPPSEKIEQFDVASAQSFTFRDALTAIARKRGISKPFIGFPHAWMAMVFKSLGGIGISAPLRLIQTAAQGESYHVHPTKVMQKYGVSIRNPVTEFERCI